MLIIFVLIVLVVAIALTLLPQWLRQRRMEAGDAELWETTGSLQQKSQGDGVEATRVFYPPKSEREWHP